MFIWPISWLQYRQAIHVLWNMKTFEYTKQYVMLPCWIVPGVSTIKPIYAEQSMHSYHLRVANHTEQRGRSVCNSF